MAHAGEDLVDAFDASLDDFGGDQYATQSHRRPRVLNPPAPCNFRVSLVGLPNSGKSCIFNILTGRAMSQEDVSLFSTADMYISTFPIFDERLDWLSDIVYKSTKKRPQMMTLIDNPGIIPGSHAGEGLGSDFLAKSRSCDVIFYVLRAFINDDVTHPNEEINPVRDFREIDQELMCRDLFFLDEILNDYEKQSIRAKPSRERELELSTMIKVWTVLSGRRRQKFGEKPPEKDGKPDISRWRRHCGGTPIRYANWDSNEVSIIRKLDLLTAKEIVIILNMAPRDFLRSENQWVPMLQEELAIPYPKYLNPKELAKREAKKFAGEGADYDEDEDEEMKTELMDFARMPRQADAVIIPFSVTLEKSLAEIYATGGSEAVAAYYKANPTHHSGILALANSLFSALSLVRFYTANEIESKAWSVTDGSTIIAAARAMDVELERCFNYADIMPYSDFFIKKGDIEVMISERLIRPQGKQYVLGDGDIVNVKVISQTEMKQKQRKW